MIQTFADVVSTSLARRVPQRLLFVFVRATQAEPHDTYSLAGARLEPVLYLDRVLSSELRFRELVYEADQIRRDWDFVLISSLSKRSGGFPSQEEAQAHMRDRAEAALTSGDLSRFLAFSRNEQALALQAERRVH